MSNPILILIYDFLWEAKDIENLNIFLQEINPKQFVNLPMCITKIRMDHEQLTSNIMEYCLNSKSTFFQHTSEIVVHMYRIKIENVGFLEVILYQNNSLDIRSNFETQYEKISRKIFKMHILMSQNLIIAERYGENIVIRLPTKTETFTKIIFAAPNLKINFVNEIHFFAVIYKKENSILQVFRRAQQNLDQIEKVLIIPNVLSIEQKGYNNELFFTRLLGHQIIEFNVNLKAYVAEHFHKFERFLK